jgi:hypothetical protein
VSFSQVIIYRGGGLAAVWRQFAVVSHADTPLGLNIRARHELDQLIERRITEPFPPLGIGGALGRQPWVNLAAPLVVQRDIRPREIRADVAGRQRDDDPRERGGREPSAARAPRGGGGRIDRARFLRNSCGPAKGAKSQSSRLGAPRRGGLLQSMCPRACSALRRAVAFPLLRRDSEP